MVNISRKTWAKNGAEVIIFNGKKWLNEKHIEDHLTLKFTSCHTAISSRASKTKKRITKLWQVSVL